MTYLPDDEWLPLAQALPQGSRKKVPHNCGPGDCLMVGHSDTGWSAYCFRCHGKAFKPYPPPTLAERIARKQAREAAEYKARVGVYYPTPANRTPHLWPKEARLWLYKAGLSDERITNAGIYYHENLERVVLPAGPGYWQARAAGWRPGCSYPKYINPRADKPAHLWYHQGKVQGCVPATSADTEGPLVIVEDILSAIKVSCTDAAVRPLLGTDGAIVVRDILQRIGGAGTTGGVATVHIWLDPDGAGQRAASRIERELSVLAVETSRVQSKVDPKLLSFREIREALNVN